MGNEREFEVLAASRADAQRLAELRTAAFAVLEIDRTIWPNVDVEEHNELTAARYVEQMGDENKRIMKAVLSDASTGQEVIVGCATWIMPMTDDEAAADGAREAARGFAFARGSNVEVAERFFSDMGKHGELVQRESGPHIHLAILATDEVYRKQAKGVGRTCLAHSLLSTYKRILTRRVAQVHCWRMACGSQESEA